ncbi:MAG: metalloprotease TldD [Hylemonella sp.]|nr:metalloprotease TldD [Hylemonella sp.]
MISREPTLERLAIARDLLLTPFGLDESHLTRALAEIRAHRVDDADLYFQYTRSEGWSLEEGIVKTGSFSIDQGVGVRAVSGEKTAFAYSDDISEASLLDAAHTVRTISSAAKSMRVKAGTPKIASARSLYPGMDPIATLDSTAKVKLLETVEQLARARDPRVVQVMASLSGERRIVEILRADGRLIRDVRPLSRINIQVTVEKDGRREVGFSGAGGRAGFEGWISPEAWHEQGEEALRQALVNLEAVACPAGEMDVVLGPGWNGVLLHEAVGHGLEGDFNRKGTSAFSGRIGERVAAPGVTVFDDGTLAGRRGSLTIDDEGTPTERTILIEDGILVGYMHDRMSARLMGLAATGNGRRQSYAHMPMPRMTNTAMMGGSTPREEMIASTKRGLYCANFGGGQVDITNGKFVFQCTEAYLIEDGRITSPVKGATLIGDGPSALTRVTMIGDDFDFDPGVGVCGKSGQSVPVGVGQPSLKLTGLTVGGTSI